VPRIVREAEIVWEGTTARGSGVVTAVSSGAFALPTTNASRIADPGGKTSPEELIAAAHASCFVTSLGSELARAEKPPERMDVRCMIVMDEVEGGDHRIVSSSITARARVPECDEATFQKAAEDADAGCPISALIRGTATVTVEARLDEGGS
jgi:osmotically inducible protein OsmC